MLVLIQEGNERKVFTVIDCENLNTSISDELIPFLFRDTLMYYSLLQA